MNTFKKPLLYLAIATMGLAACNNDKAPAVTSSKEVALTDTLSLREAWRYVHNFDKYASKIDSLTKEPNTRAIWFSKVRLKHLLEQLEKNNLDGVRFYYATYDKIGVNGPKAGELGHNTLVLASTYLDGKLHRDSYLKKAGQNGSKGFLLSVPPENRGEMCPPPKACDSVGAALLSPDPATLDNL